MAEVGRIVTLFYIIAVSLVGGEAKEAQYFGKSLGKLSQLHHGVSGEVFAVDGRTLYIKDFTYDGQGPAAYFYASTQKAADKNGFRLKDESGNGQVIRKYRKEGITLTLPEGKTLNNIKIFYVWCEEFDVNFGDVKIARNLDIPRPQKIDSLNGVHGISSDSIVIVDAQTLLIPNLSYDGEAPDAKFWVGRGLKPTPNGIRVPDENGKQVPLRRYDKKTVVLTLPGDLTVFDIGHFGIWCEQFTVDFGHVLIPQPLNVPPSLKMLGVSPQKRQQVHETLQSLGVRASNLADLPATTFRPPIPHYSFRRNDALLSPPLRSQPDLIQYHVSGQQPPQGFVFVQQMQPFALRPVYQYVPQRQIEHLRLIQPAPLIQPTIQQIHGIQPGQYIHQHHQAQQSLQQTPQISPNQKLYLNQF